MIRVPDHDALIQHIQSHLIEAVALDGWPTIRDLCEEYDISPTVLRKLYLWDPKDKTSFNLRKLIQMYDFAYDMIHNRVS